MNEVFEFKTEWEGDLWEDDLDDAYKEYTPHGRCDGNYGVNKHTLNAVIVAGAPVSDEDRDWTVSDL